MSEEKKNVPAPASEKKPANAKPSLISRIGKWFSGLKSELKKVSWPSRAQVTNNTWVVLVVTCVCTIAVWGFDYVAQLIVRTLIEFAG